MIKSLIKKTLFLLVLGMLTACTSKSDDSHGDKTKTIRINCTSSYGHSVLQLIKAQGLLEEKLPVDISVEWTNINSTTEIRDALVTNHLDVGALAMPTTIIAIDRDMPISILSNSVVQSTVLYGAKPEIQSLDDIDENGKIGIVNIGGAYHLALMLESEEHYGDLRRFDDNLVTMQNAELFASVHSSDILDGIIVGFPNTIKADNDDTLHQMLDLTPVSVENGMSFLIVAAEQFFSENTDLVEILQLSIQKTIAFMNERPQEAAELLSEFYGDIPTHFIKEQIKAAAPKYEVSEKGYNAISRLMSEVGIIEGEPRKMSELRNYDRIPKAE